MTGTRQWTKQAPSLVLGLEALALQSAHALLVRLALNPLVDVSREQTIDGQAKPSVGWLLTADLLPVPDSQIAKLCKLTDDEVQAAIAELIAVGIAVRSDQGSLGLAGWALTQVSADAIRMRDRRQEEREKGRKSRAKPEQDPNRVQNASLSLSLFSSSLEAVGKQKTDEIMDTWHKLRVDLGILKTRVAARRANEGELKALASIDPDDMLLAIRRMAESIRREAEEEAIPPDQSYSARFFTIDHLLRPKNRQRYLDQPDLDERRPQRKKNAKGGRHFKPGLYEDEET